MLTLAALALLALGSETVEPPSPSGLTHIVCLGDGITAGEGLGRAARHAWPAQLRERLNVDHDYDAFPVEVVTAAGATLSRAGGAPITGAAEFERLTTVVDYHHVVVMLGTNDALAAGGAWGDVERWDAELEHLVQRLRARRTDARVLFVGPPMVSSTAPGLSPDRRAVLVRGAERIQELQDRMTAFAATRRGVEYCGLSGELRAGDLTDGVHPNPFGHERIARAVHRAIAPQLGLPLDPRAAMVPAPSAEYRGGAGWGGGTWWDAFGRLVALGRAEADARIVFFGDSITQGLTGDGERVARSGGDRAIDRVFGDDGAVVLGLSGDRTEHLRFRARKGALRWMSPRAIVLQIGINNLNSARHPPDDVALGIRAVVDDLRRTQPWSTILVCGPFPAGRTADDPLRRAVDAVHEGIESIGDGTESAVLGGRPQVRYLDLRALFLDEDGTPGEAMGGDALHVNATGRELWMKAIEPVIRAELDRPLVPDLPAELAWLVANDDYPRLSRALVTLAPGEAGPRRRVQPILYSFDASDGSDHAAAADGTWVFTGPVRDRRGAPNVGLPLSAISRGGELESWPVQARHFAVSPGGTLVATASVGSVSIVDLVTGEHTELLDAAALGRTTPKGIGWRPDGRVALELGSVAGGRAGALSPGRWAVDAETGEYELDPASPGQAAPATSYSAAISEILGEHRGSGRSFEDVEVRDGWVVACRIEADGTRTVHLFRLDSREHYPLGKGMRPRWGGEK